MNIFIDPEFSSYYERFPLVLIDVGASGALQENWKSAQKYLKVIGFEPDARSFQQFCETPDSTYVKYLKCALFNEKTSLDFYLTRKHTSSSIFKPNRLFLDRFPESERFDIVGSRQLNTDTLDNQVQENHIVDVDFIKLDTEGSELFILQSATNTLNNLVFGLEIEVGFVQMYEKQPLFSEVDSFTRKCGFQLFDLKPYFWKRATGKDYSNRKGQIIFADALYLREVETYENLVSKIEDETVRKSKVFKALSICILYGYVDYALEVYDRMGFLLDAKERQIVDMKLRSEIHLSRRIPNFYGRGRLANLVYQVYRILAGEYKGWASSARVLGNLE